jgi:hypothetical protein
MKIRTSEDRTMKRFLLKLASCWAAFFGLMWLIGCNIPLSDYTSEHGTGPVPLREPSPAKAAPHSYEDSLTGGDVFRMYCQYCHQARAIAERPFSSYKNVAAHMRVRANLTAKEYAALQAWLRRMHDIPAGDAPPIEPSPKRLIYGQAIPELKPKE